jgi:hypothetical protein
MVGSDAHSSSRSSQSPTWRSDPLSGPAHFLHAGAWCFIAFGVAALVPAIRFGGGDPVFSLMGIPLGTGLLIGSGFYFSKDQPPSRGRRRRSAGREQQESR